jgi:hypothetical protein
VRSLAPIAVEIWFEKSRNLWRATKGRHFVSDGLSMKRLATAISQDRIG